MNPYYRCFEAADGFLAVACLNLAQREAFLGLFGLDDATIAAPDRGARTMPPSSRAKQRVTAAVERAIAAEPVEAWLARLGSAAVPAGPVLTRESVHADAQARANGLLQDVEQPGLGPMTMLGGVFRFDGERSGRDATCAVARRRHGGGPGGGGGMRFTIEPELELFAESVRGALAGWEAPLEPVFGEWQDDRDDALAARLEAVGWGELWSDPELLGPAVAGGIELGRACRAALPRRRGDARVRRSRSAGACVTARGGSRAESASRRSTARARCVASSRRRLPSDPARLHAWGAVTLAYLAGLADGALEKAVEHARSRGSSSALRSPRCRRCRHGSRMRPWHATAWCSRPGRPPTPRPASRATRSPGRAAPAAR